MNRGSVLNLPFLGQIVKVITRDGREYEIKISEEVRDNPYLFSVMYRVSDGSSNGGYDPQTLKPNRPPPPIVRIAKPDNKSISNSKYLSKTISKPVMEKEYIKDTKSKVKQPDEDKKNKRKGINDIGKIVVK